MKVWVIAGGVCDQGDDEVIARGAVLLCIVT